MTITRDPSVVQNLLSTDPGQNCILQYLDVTDHARLMQTSYSMYQFFNTLSPIFWFEKLKKDLAQIPNEKKTHYILKRNLNLLNAEFKQIVLPFYTVTNVTPLQFVHGAGDIEMRDRVLKPLFIEHYGSIEKGLEEMNKQISVMKNVHKRFDFGPILQAISNETFNNWKWEALSPTTIVAINVFQKKYAENQPKIIDKGMQFRWETLQEFMNDYIAVATRWRNHHYSRHILVRDVVLREILRYATQNDKQRFNQGLYYLQKIDPEPFKRMQTNRMGYNFDLALNRPTGRFPLDGCCVDLIHGLIDASSTLGFKETHLQIFVEKKLQECRIDTVLSLKENIRVPS